MGAGAQVPPWALQPRFPSGASQRPGFLGFLRPQVAGYCGAARHSAAGPWGASGWGPLQQLPLSPRPPDGQSYQNSTIDQSFWEAFGSADPRKAHRSPSSDSWTCADASAEKRSSDSWDMWGSGSASNDRNSDSGGGETCGGGREGRAKTARKAAPPPVVLDEGWDTQDW